MYLYTYETMGTWGVVDPYPIRTIISQPVLASVLVVTTGSTHFDEGYYPLAVKRFVLRATRMSAEKLELVNIKVY